MSPMSPSSDTVTSVEHLTLVVTKQTRATTIGIRLQNGYRGLEITDVFANGPLAGIVQEGDMLVAIDGDLCLSGHKKAIRCLREKVGDVVLTIAPSQPQRLQSLTAIPLDAGGELNLAAPSSRMRRSSSPPLYNAGEAESFQRETPVTAAAEAMLKGVYSETLARNGTRSSMGMNLSQLRWDGLPTIESIDPAGPAAGTSICVGDILLEVNGFSASTDLKTLKRALGNETRAVLTLLRKEADPLRLTACCNSSHLEKAHVEKTHVEILKARLGEFSYRKEKAHLEENLQHRRLHSTLQELQRLERTGAPLDFVGNPRYTPLRSWADRMPLPHRQRQDGQPGSSEHESRTPLDFVLQPIRELGEGLGQLGGQVGQLFGQ